MSQRIVAMLPALVIAIVAAGCGSNSDETSPTSAPATPTVTGSQVPPITIPRSELSLRGENVEKVADSAVQRITWPDGTVYEETIPALMLTTVGRPDAPHGRRVVARWLEDDRWQVTIFLRIEDHSTDPPTVIDLRAELYYDEGSSAFEPANGRAYFALTGRDPCASDQPSADLCPLDKEIHP
jgi:hypothetical protein